MADLGTIGESHTEATERNYMPLDVPTAASGFSPQNYAETHTESNERSYAPLDVYAAKNVSLSPINGMDPYLDVYTIAPGDRKFYRGFVKDSLGNPYSRTVICIDEVAKAVVDTTVSSPVDGSFTVRPLTTNPVSVFYLPNIGDNKLGNILCNLAPVST